MEPNIRFAKTEDGGAVAFWEAGEGPSLLHLPWLPWGHAQLEWRDSDLRLWYERLCSVCHLVRYDGRGSGLSDWETANYGLETQLRDIEAVLERLQTDRICILASLNMGPAGITFAKRYPHRVSSLILWCTYASSEEYNSRPQVRAIRNLLAEDWELYTETGAHAFVGWQAGEAAHRIAQMMARSTTKDIVARFYADMADVDVSDLLETLETPVFVLHPREFPLVDVNSARRMAAAAPDGHMLLFEGSSLSPTRGDLDGVLLAIAEILAESQTTSIRRTSASAPTGAEDTLSSREAEVLRLVARGLSNRQIADALVISPRTVERHVENIFGKIGVNNRVQASAYAMSNGLAD